MVKNTEIMQGRLRDWRWCEPDWSPQATQEMKIEKKVWMERGLECVAQLERERVEEDKGWDKGSES